MKLSSFFGGFFGRTKNTVDRAELVEMLQKIKRPTFITIESLTYPRAKAKGTVTKEARTNGVFFWRYKCSVNRRRVKEGKEANFEPEPRKWGQRVGNLVFHEGKWYIELQVRSVIWEKFAVDGEPTPKDQIGLPVRKEGARQGLREVVVVRDFGLDSVTKVRMFGQDFVVKEKLTRTKKKAFGKILHVATQRKRVIK